LSALRIGQAWPNRTGVAEVSQKIFEVGSVSLWEALRFDSTIAHLINNQVCCPIFGNSTDLVNVAAARGSKSGGTHKNLADVISSVWNLTLAKA
jgi:hypothetical protein